MSFGSSEKSRVEKRVGEEGNWWARVQGLGSFGRLTKENSCFFIILFSSYSLH